MVFILLFINQHGRNMEGVTVIESFSSMKQGDPLRGLLFATHYQAFLKTIAQAPNYLFPSLRNNIHIVGPMSEITYAFDHLLTQLALIGLRVKLSKCKF
jgi:hypothetical protein